MLTKGTCKYMNYDRYTKDPVNSALFNGNATSMGGNGAPDPNYTGLRTSAGLIKSGGGGGCVTEGPFKELVVPCWSSGNISGLLTYPNNTVTERRSVPAQL